jgi:hypothetical protein
MSSYADHDTLALARLTVLRQQLEDLEQAITLAVAGAPLPWPVAEVFVRLAAAAEVCERLIADHALGGARLRDDTLSELAVTLRMVREVTTALVGIALSATGRGVD